MACVEFKNFLSKIGNLLVENIRILDSNYHT